MIKVSVIVPVYNVEKYLKQCLSSLVNQTLDEIEIIVVNDGTKDNSQSIIDDFKKQNPNKIISLIKENGGLSSARNYGLQYAQGEYIAFVDSDDFVDITMYEKMYSKAKEYNYDLVCCDFNELRNQKICPCSCKIDEDLKQKKKITEAMVDFYPSAWNKLYKHQLLKDYDMKFKVGVWFEDVEFIYRLLPYITSIGVVHEHFYQYVIREGSITSKIDARIYHYIDNWNGLLEYYYEHNLYDDYQQVLEYNYVRYLYATFIKSATKFNKDDFLIATEKAIDNVNSHFPNYKRNIYINQRGWKNVYLKFFSVSLAKVIYWKYHH